MFREYCFFLVCVFQGLGFRVFNCFGYFFKALLGLLRFGFLRFLAFGVFKTVLFYWSGVFRVYDLGLLDF